ncbi:DUF938 domain-containing protein [Shewanella sp. MMG014]|nr:DUF938 domain-containing protein [Shewanella sp. MMG014]
MITSLSQLPFSQACENNKHAIIKELQQILATRQQVLEIGSGTGQHCVFFSSQLPHLQWQASDQPSYLADLNRRITLEGSVNLIPAIALDVMQSWPQALNESEIDAVFTANTLHIMSQAMVNAFFNQIGKHISQDAALIIYGPFNYKGRYTSESNESFDQWLKENNPESGIRDIEWIETLATEQGFKLQHDFAMPANNRLLHFSR